VDYEGAIGVAVRLSTTIHSGTPRRHPAIDIGGPSQTVLPPTAVSWCMPAGQFRLRQPGGDHGNGWQTATPTCPASAWLQPEVSGIRWPAWAQPATPAARTHFEMVITGRNSTRWIMYNNALHECRRARTVPVILWWRGYRLERIKFYRLQRCLALSLQPSNLQPATF
jgi:hypothetical protein